MRRWSDRSLFRAAFAVTVVPIVVAAVRLGWAGWIPIRDASPTVIRAHHALGSRPQLVGMYTDASDWIDVAAYFPGPWQLWWMWAPVRLGGSTWGPLVAMAALNVFWVWLAAWFVRRRLGVRAAIGTLAAMAVLCWVLSPALLVSPVPMVMILVPFAAFCFGAWALASGDDGALPALAFVTSFLLVDHLVLSILVPVLALAAATMWLAGVVVDRRRDPDAWRIRRPGLVRSVAGAVAVTLVLWAPAVIQQLFGDSGNLGNLARAAANQPASTRPFGAALERWVAVLAPPDFWLRSSREHSPFAPMWPGMSTTLLIVTLAGLTLIVAVPAVRAWRHRDRPVLAALALAVTGFFAVWVSLQRAPGADGPHPAYAQSSWVVAMFITFAIAVGVVRMLPGRLRGAALPATGVALVVCTILNLPHANVSDGVTSGTDANIELSRRLVPRVVEALRGRGLVGVQAHGLTQYTYATAGVVGLHDAGIPVCVHDIPQFQPSPVDDCSANPPDVEIRFAAAGTGDDAGEGWQVLVRETPLNSAEEARHTALTDRLTRAVDQTEPEGGHLELTPEFSALVETVLGAPPDPETNPLLAPLGRDGVLHHRDGRGLVAALVLWGQDLIETHDAQGVRVFDLALDPSEVAEWAELTDRRVGRAVEVRIRTSD